MSHNHFHCPKSFVSEDGGIPSAVFSNAAVVTKKIGKADKFAILVEVERIGQTISVPLVQENRITVTGG